MGSFKGDITTFFIYNKFDKTLTKTDSKLQESHMTISNKKQKPNRPQKMFKR